MKTTRVNATGQRIYGTFFGITLGLFSLFGAATPVALAQSPGTWAVTGSMTTTRWQHTETDLANGEVLVAGGLDSSGTPLSSAELYDPATGVWTPTGSMTSQRAEHSATLLPSGQVLVAGGQGTSYSGALASAELYDPATGTWTPTASMSTARAAHMSTLITSGPHGHGEPGSELPENPRVLANLGHEVARDIIAKILKEHGLEPASERERKTTWKEFLFRHREVTVAADFFTIEAWTHRG